MSSSTAPTYLPPPSSFAHHSHSFVEDSSSTFRPLSTAATSSSGHNIALHKQNFPLLHSLLESPAYREALAANPALAQHPTSRRTDEAKSSSKQAKSRPPKSSSAGTAVTDLWAKVPRGEGTGSSVAGGRATRSAVSRVKRSSDEKWEFVGDEEQLESLQDGLLGFSLAAAKGKTPGPTPLQPASSLLSRKTSLRERLQPPATVPNVVEGQSPPPLQQNAPRQTRRLPPLPANSPFAPQFPQRRSPLPPIPSSAAAKPPASVSLPPPALSAPVPPSASSKPHSHYPTPPTRDLHISTSKSTLPSQDGPAHPPTSFQSTVSQLKRMLTRTSKPCRASRSSMSPSSFDGGSILSQSTVHGGGDGGEGRRSTRASMLSQSPSSSFANLTGEVEELVMTPTTYDKSPFPSRLPVGDPTSAGRRRSSFIAHASASVPSPSLSAQAASTPADFSSLPPSFKSPLSFTTSTTSSCQLSPRARPPLNTSISSANKLRARSPPGSRSAASAREARSQLLGLLRDGPEAVARVSPALMSDATRRAMGSAVAEQATSVKEGKEGKKSRGGLRWKGSMQGLRWKPSLGGQRRSSRSSTLNSARSGMSPVPMETFSMASTDLDSISGGETWQPSSSSPPLSHSSSFAPRPPPPQPLSRAHSLDNLASSGVAGEGWTVEEVARPTSLYSSYGNRWEVEMGGRGTSVYATRTSDSMGAGGGGGEEERKVWRKWRGWVKERRERDS